MPPSSINRPKIDYMKVNRRKKQARNKQLGKAEAAKKSQLNVSAKRTKKHAKKVAHRAKMLQQNEEAVAQAEAAAQKASEDVDMDKVKSRKPKKPKTKAMQE